MEKIFREKELERIIKHYGRRQQHIKAVEEMSELTKEICKYFCNEGNKQNLEEEMADVQIMINQLMIMHGITPSDIEYQMNQKILRTIKRMEKQDDNE